jgi:transposase
MAYHEVAMWEILSVLERLHRRESKAAIMRATGHSRSTVRRYEQLARDLGWTPEGAAPTEAMATEIGRRVHPAAERDAGEVEAVLRPHVDQLRTWLTPPPGEKRGLRLTKVHQLLGRRGIDVPYSSLHRFVVKHCAFGTAGRVTVRMAASPPGEVGEIDFGRLGLIPDPSESAPDRRRTAWALVVVLPASRHQYVHVTFTQTVAAVIDGLEAAWQSFGGVPRRVVLDNLRAAIAKADRYDPIFQRTMEEYARYRGFVLDPAPVRTPTGKPHVERSVPYVRDNFFRGETWRDLAHVQERAGVWARDVAGQRVHGTTRQRPLAVFEAEERATLLPVVGERFDTPRWAHCTVHPDHHISFGKALYSVPTRYLRQRLWVRGDSRLVRIYAAGEVIKTHPTQPAGGRATDHADYPAERTAYTQRDPARLIRQAEEHGAQIGRFTAALLAGVFPWAKLRQAQRLMRLGEKYGWQRVDGACQRALAFELLNVARVERILELDLDHRTSGAAEEASPVRVYPLRPRFARPDTSFAADDVVELAPAPSPPLAISDDRSESVS